MDNRNYFKDLVVADPNNNQFQTNMRKGEIDQAFDLMEIQKNLHDKIRDSMSNIRNFLLGRTYKIDDRYVIYEDLTELETVFKTFDIEKNRSISRGSHSIHEQILVTLGEHYEDENSQFWNYACKMLGID